MYQLFEKYVDRKGTACIKWDFQDMDYGKTNLLPFSIADADYQTFGPIKKSLIDRIAHGIVGYSDVDEQYKESVCSWVEKRHNWKIDSEWIISTGAIVPTISFAIEAFTNVKDGIIVQPPIYDPFYTVIEATNRTLIKNDLLLTEDGYMMNFESLEKQAKNAKAIILCSPHNPVGRVWNEEELSRLVDICKRSNLLIISDEIHWDIILGDNSHITMGKFTEIYENLVVCSSISKTFNLAGLAASNFIIPNIKRREIFLNYLYSRYLFCANTLGMEAYKTAYRHGEEWVDEQNSFLEKNFQLLKEFFTKNIPLATVANLEGTYLAWIDLRYLKKSSDELINILASEGVALAAGIHYGENYDGFVRMNIACPQVQLEKGLTCILNAVRKIKEA